MNKNFTPFKSGDVVRLNKNFPYINRELLTDEIYVIDRMIGVAGVVTLEGQDPAKTFPEDAFIKVMEQQYTIE